MQKFVAGLAGFGAVIVAQLCGGRFAPTPAHPRTALWYASLRKPTFTPPGPAFGAAWTGLDALLGYSSYRLLIAPRSPRRLLALSSWAATVLGVAGFSWVLFGRRRLDEALGVTVGMVGAAAAAIGTASLVDRRAAWANAPLFGWLLFATVLQEEVWRRNPQAGPGSL